MNHREAQCVEIQCTQTGRLSRAAVHSCANTNTSSKVNWTPPTCSSSYSTLQHLALRVVATGRRRRGMRRRGRRWRGEEKEGVPLKRNTKERQSATKCGPLVLASPPTLPRWDEDVRQKKPNKDKTERQVRRNTSSFRRETVKDEEENKSATMRDKKKSMRGSVQLGKSNGFTLRLLSGGKRSGC